MRKYIEPKIKVVSLDPNQAALQVCSINGIYMNPAYSSDCLLSGTGVTSQCSLDVRGKQYSNKVATASTDAYNAPS